MPEAELVISRHFVHSSENEGGGGLEDSDGCSRRVASSIRGMVWTMHGFSYTGYGLACVRGRGEGNVLSISTITYAGGRESCEDEGG